jgi:hypothetical protein
MKRFYRWSRYYIHPILPPQVTRCARDVPLLPSRITGREEGIGEGGWDGKWNPSISEVNGKKKSKWVIESRSYDQNTPA